MAEFNSEDQGSFRELKQSMEAFSNIADETVVSIFKMYEGADKLNNAFLQGRTRLDEMSDAVAKSAAGVLRLGGNISDVNTTMAGIAEGARRNVIATEDQVSKLYAASTILETTSSSLVENFAQIGIETSQIGTNLEGSIGYIQSVGLNAKTVMKDVSDNMGQMNRFQFEGGVQGLAKMAAQASMLRFDMKQTFDLANRVLDPEGAIDTAAAFQRLGVSVGNLADPFQLMNQSINDPSGLQDSLANVAKSFTYFDEKTQSFKINPQGVLTLREMEKQTGVSAAEMSKMGLAAADLDKRLSAISPSLKFEKEEDRQLLANMATKKDGEYVVQIKDDQGAIEYKKLGEITTDEFKELRKKQEEAPKTLEEIQISQLDYLKDSSSSLRSILGKGTFGVAGSTFVRGNFLGAERISRGFTGSLDENIPKSADISKDINSSVEKMKELFNKKELGKISDTDFATKLSKLESEVKSKVSTLGEKGIETLIKTLEDTNKKNTGTSGIEEKFKKYSSDILSEVGRPQQSSNKGSKISGTSNVSPISKSSFLGKQNVTQTSATGSVSKNINSQVDFGGTITIKVDAPPGISEQQFKTFFESEEFKKKIYEYYNQKAKELERR
jgi:hypothetical protein